MTSTHGIASLALALPSLALPAERLAALRGVDPAKYAVGLGVRTLALCAPGEDAGTLAVRAAERALARAGIDRARIGLVAVGTESARDMSRPLSQVVCEGLGLSGAIRSYEVKHACYGGTLALLQALEWRRSGAARGRAALVVATDVALYALEDGGEPTQGAGAVAFVVDGSDVAEVLLPTYTHAEPAFDFYRPVGQLFPSVDGPLSHACYVRAASRCFAALEADPERPFALDEADAVAFHVPFPKMVVKAVRGLGEVFGWDAARTEDFLTKKVEPGMRWNRDVGNAYTASAWLSAASLLAGMRPGGKLLVFSYGSGFGAELLALRAGPAAAFAAFEGDLRDDLAARRTIDEREYVALRAEHVGRR